MKNEYFVTWKLYRSWMFEGNVKKVRLRLYLMISWCILLAACLFLGIWTHEILFFGFAVYCAYMAFFRNLLLANKQFKTMGDSFKKKEWVRTILFEDDCITISDGDVLVIKYPYSDIVGIRERGDKIWLDMQDKTVIRLYQSAFVDTDWDKCKEWIESHREQETPEEEQETPGKKIFVSYK